MQIYIHKDGRKSGPFTLEQLREKVLQGSFTEEDYACHDYRNWVTIGQVPGYVLGGQSHQQHLDALGAEAQSGNVRSVGASLDSRGKDLSSVPSTRNPIRNTTNSKKPKRHQLVFSGSGSEFFGIWIVNILLSIVTLGIYSAWAKVRTMNYFYGSTSLAGSSFAYVANPVVILKGRIIAFVFFLLYMLLSQVEPLLIIPLTLLIFFLAPVIIVRSLRFRMGNTEYRGLRFGFAGTTGESYWVFIVILLLSSITLGILFPWFYMRKKQFYIGNIQFGGSQFLCMPRTGHFYACVGICFAMVFGAVLFFVVVAVAFEAITSGTGLLFTTLVPLCIYPMMGVVSAYWHANTTNHVITSSRLEDITFESRLTTGGLIGLWVTNILLLVCTVGLATPWVMIRNARYRISCTSIIAHDLDSFVVEKIDSTSALGNELSEAFDVDLAI
jgi:uncharacterized membrane protein YjgN (DUF898 family)